MSAHCGHYLCLMPVCGDAVGRESCRDGGNHAVRCFLITVHIIIRNCDELDSGRAVVTGVGWNVRQEMLRLFEKTVSCDAL